MKPRSLPETRPPSFQRLAPLLLEVHRNDDLTGQRDQQADPTLTSRGDSLPQPCCIDCGLSSVEIVAHGVPVEACRLKLAHDHAHVLLAEVLFAVTRNTDNDAGLVAKAPMARGLAAQFGKAVIS